MFSLLIITQVVFDKKEQFLWHLMRHFVSTVEAVVPAQVSRDIAEFCERFLELMIDLQVWFRIIYAWSG